MSWHAPLPPEHVRTDGGPGDLLAATHNLRDLEVLEKPQDDVRPGKAVSACAPSFRRGFPDMEALDAEALSDRLVSHFGSREAFRLILYPVEATLPVMEMEAEAEDPEIQKPEDKPTPERISREELYEDLSQAGRVTPVYLVMIALSSLVAAVGLNRGDVAIVIGAMVIAPLLGPNIALSLASALGDPHLARRSLRAIGYGVVTAAAISLLLGIVFPVDPTSPELAARTSAGLGDIVIALSAGTAGSLAFTS